MRRRPIPGLRHAIFPYWPGWRLPEPEPAISLLPGVARQPRKLHMWRSCGFPGASLPPDPSLLSTHIHTIWNNTNRTEMDCTTHRLHNTSKCWIERRNWFSENGSESRDGADEPCLPPDNLPTLPSEGLPVSLRQRDGSGEQIVNILVTRIKTQSCPQTDYFCTVCEESLKEEELQSHLFEGHSAENLQVRAGTDALNQYRSSELQYCQCFLKHTPIHCLPSSMRWCYLTLTIL